MSNEKLTDSQLELKKRIEEKTAAKVNFEPRFSAEEQFTARIVWEHLFTDEDGDLAKELIELSFIADRPRKKPMTEPRRILSSTLRASPMLFASSLTESPHPTPADDGVLMSLAGTR